MGRLVWTLLPALALHVLFLLAAVPDRDQRLPGVKGSGRITVSIDRLGSQPPAVSERDQREAAYAGAVERRKEKRTAAGHSPEKEPAPRIGPKRTKKVIRAAPADERGGVSEAGGNAAAAAPQAGSRSGTGMRAAASGSAAGEAVRLAVPVPAENRPPDYPELARRRGWEGTVLLAVRVGVDGRVDQAEVRSGSSYRLLDEAALRAVRRWRFQPGTRDGEPEAMEVPVPVHFVLREAEW